MIPQDSPDTQLSCYIQSQIMQHAKRDIKEHLMSKKAINKDVRKLQTDVSRRDTNLQH